MSFLYYKWEILCLYDFTIACSCLFFPGHMIWTRTNAVTFSELKRSQRGLSSDKACFLSTPSHIISMTSLSHPSHVQIYILLMNMVLNLGLSVLMLLKLLMRTKYPQQRTNLPSKQTQKKTKRAKEIKADSSTVRF